MYSLCNEKGVDKSLNCCLIFHGWSIGLVVKQCLGSTIRDKKSCVASPVGRMAPFVLQWKSNNRPASIVQTLFITLGLHTLAWTCLLYLFLYFLKRVHKEMINRTKRVAHYLPLLLDNKLMAKDDFFTIKELVRDSKWTAFSTWKYHR